MTTITVHDNSLLGKARRGELRPEEDNAKVLTWFDSLSDEDDQAFAETATSEDEAWSDRPGRRDLLHYQRDPVEVLSMVQPSWTAEFNPDGTSREGPRLRSSQNYLEPIDGDYDIHDDEPEEVFEHGGLWPPYSIAGEAQARLEVFFDRYLLRLTEAQRSILQDHLDGRMAFSVIAEPLGQRKQSAHNRFVRARRALIRAIAKDDPDFVQVGRKHDPELELQAALRVAQRAGVLAVTV